MNFHLSNGIYFRRNGDQIRIVKATGFDDPGELIAATDLGGFASVVASASPHREQNHSYDFVHKFLKRGTMFCGGCGAKLTPESPGVGYLSVVNFHSCRACYESKFKPLFDWGMHDK